MTDARELMAMMTCHGIEIGRPFGGIPKLTALDVAGAMGMGLGADDAALLMAKYCHDGQQYAEARVHWFMRVMDQKAHKGWTSDQPGRFKGLADVTLDEFVGHNLCRTCRGTGQVMRQQKPVPCITCDGVGRRALTASRLARGIGISRQSYSAVWADRVEWCRRALTRWELDAAERLARALRQRA